MYTDSKEIDLCFFSSSEEEETMEDVEKKHSKKQQVTYALNEDINIICYTQLMYLSIYSI